MDVGEKPDGETDHGSVEDEDENAHSEDNEWEGEDGEDGFDYGIGEGEDEAGSNVEPDGFSAFGNFAEPSDANPHGGATNQPAKKEK